MSLSIQPNYSFKPAGHPVPAGFGRGKGRSGSSLTRPEASAQVSFGNQVNAGLNAAKSLLPEVQGLIKQWGPIATTAFSLFFPGIALGAGVALAVGFPMLIKSLGAQVCQDTGKVQNLKQVSQNASGLIRRVLKTLGKPFKLLPKGPWQRNTYRHALRFTNTLKHFGLNYVEQEGAQKLLKAIPKGTLGRIGYFTRWIFLGLGMALGHHLKKLFLIGTPLALLVKWMTNKNGASTVMNRAFGMNDHDPLHSDKWSGFMF